MPVSELGERMSAHELTAIWPAFFRHKEREAKREADKRDAGRRKVR